MANYTATITRGRKTHTLEMTNYEEGEVYQAVALWLLRIGYKPPRFFGLIVADELRVFPKEVLRLMRKYA